MITAFASAKCFTTKLERDIHTYIFTRAHANTVAKYMGILWRRYCTSSRLLTRR